jgi:tripartite-type tricarboxylate transporter receptor subunit TctC
MPRVRPLLLAAAGLLLALAAPVAAQSDYPNRPIRLIIPFPPGGSNDVVGRVIAQHLGESLGKQVIVDNRAGAGGVIGTEVASKAAPDGYTLLGISLAHAVNPWLYKLPYDPIKAFAPIGIMGKGPVVLSVNPELPVRSVKELVAQAKGKPGDLQYASAGVGSFQHLSAELFKLTAGVDIVHIPFKGGGPAMTDVVGGHTKVLFSSLVQTTPHIKSGKLRALAVGGTERSAVLPDLPTVAEAGVPGYASENWWGIVAPAGTPAPIIEKLHQALTQAQDNPAAKKYFDTEGAAIVKMSTAAFGQFMVSEMDKWQRVVKEGNIKAE